VAGTATEVGKTFVGAALLAELRATGVRVAARKPAQSFAIGELRTDADVLAAARLAEDQKRWNVATKLYLQLKELLPSLRKTWELQLEKIERIGSQIEPADN